MMNGVLCQILEFPTLCALLDTLATDPARSEKLQARINTVQYIWFVTRLDATDLSANEQNVIKWLSSMLGEQVWRDALLVLLHNRTALPWQCASMMKKRSEIVRAEISRYTGWDIARSITAVCVGHLDELLLGDQDLETEFSASSAPQKAARAVPWQADGHTDKTSGELPRRLNSLILGYLWSGPAGALGMCLWGLPGFGIALAINALFWAIIGWLRDAKET
ncbi:MAG TPA: hypothetical protein VGU68_14025 [Ktedonobacteraceae bacterium]|nr:hypothetical protein [Ktedonobacteraceae bacterium]HEV2661721.1 hypothetical protein [Ktedonobacteraceae bacterium]